MCRRELGLSRREPLTGSRWVGVALGLFGVVTAVGAGSLAGLGKASVGQIAILLATFSSAVGVLYGRGLIRWLQKLPPPER